MAEDDFETRGTDLWPDGSFEIRMAGDGLTLEGYAAVFDMPSLPIPGGPRGAFRETIRPGSFTKTMAGNPDVTLRYQHNLATIPLGRTKSGTLRLATDTRGLHFEDSLPDNEHGRPIRDAVKRGDISGASFSFQVPSKAGEKWNADYSQRDLLEVRLGREISIVDFPAYPDTSILVRQLAEQAGVELDELAQAFSVLRQPDGRLSSAQRDLLMVAVNARTDEPFVGRKVAQAREWLAAHAKSA